MAGGVFFARDRFWQPPALTPEYRTSVARSPNRALLAMPQTLSETTGPVFAPDTVRPEDADLIHNYAASGKSAVGPRIIVYGRVMDETGRGVPNAMLEVWQANAGGRYRHRKESYIAALDPNFSGCGRCMTDAEGHYEFRTIQPGAYPWPNRANDWRPAHIHFSIFGEAFAQRLITQMYFEGDPMIRMCPIVQGIPQHEGIESLTAALDMNRAVPMDARAYKFDMVLRGRRQTMFETKMEGA